jgi:hypothetical protein
VSCRQRGGSPTVVTLNFLDRSRYFFFQVAPPRSVSRLLVTASVVLSSPILVTLMKESLSSSETSVFTRATRRNNQVKNVFTLLDLQLSVPWGTYCSQSRVLVVVLLYWADACVIEEVMETFLQILFSVTFRLS